MIYIHITEWPTNVNTRTLNPCGIAQRVIPNRAHHCAGIPASTLQVSTSFWDLTARCAPVQALSTSEVQNLITCVLVHPEMLGGYEISPSSSTPSWENDCVMDVTQACLPLLWDQTSTKPVKTDRDQTVHIDLSTQGFIRETGSLFMCSHTWKRSWHYLFFPLREMHFLLWYQWLTTNKARIPTSNQTSESEVLTLRNLQTTVTDEVWWVHLLHSRSKWSLTNGKIIWDTTNQRKAERGTFFRSADHQSAVAVLTPTGSCWSSAGHWCPAPRSAHWSSSATPDPPGRRTPDQQPHPDSSYILTPIIPTSHSQEERISTLLQNTEIFL